MTYRPDGRSHFYIKEGDRLPSLTSILKDGDGSVIDLSSASVSFYMKLPNSTALKVSSTATIDSSSEGQVTYAWSTVDTDTAGDYVAEFEITFSGGLRQSVPNDNEIQVHIRSDIG
jgi:hypothetical protein